jgi:type II secretory pathway pseudopilin PulG
MKMLVSFAAFLLTLPNMQAAQQANAQTPASSLQAATLLAQSAAALVHNVALSDVTLTGTAHRIAGSDDESGTTALKALTTGEARMDLSFPSGSRSEVVGVLNECPAGTWSGPDGVAHSVSNHNLMTDSSWFFPIFAVGRIISSGKYVLSYVGHETQNGQAVEHLTAYQSSTVPLPAGIPTFSHLTQMDLFLDSSTLLPAALAFNIHPDNNSGLDIPVQVLFSDYRLVNGAQIPFHVQKFINNSLTLDLQFTSAVLNSGLSTNSFTVGAGL